MSVYELFKNTINQGGYNVADIETKIDKFYIEGKLSEEERTELKTLCAEKASDADQINVVEKLKEHEDRIFALEHPAEEAVFPVWSAGYVTNKGETVQYDVDGDGVMELCRYDGGRASTSLRPFKIDGWHIVDTQGNILE